MACEQGIIKLWNVQGMLGVVRKDKRTKCEVIIKSFFDWLISPEGEVFNLEIMYPFVGGVFCILKRRGWGNFVPAREIVYGKVLGVRKSMRLISKSHVPVNSRDKTCSSPLVTITSWMNSEIFESLHNLEKCGEFVILCYLQTNKLSCQTSMLAEDRKHLDLRRSSFIAWSNSSHKVAAFAHFPKT